MSVSDHTSTRESNSQPGPEGRTGLVRNGVVGGAAAVLLSLLPLSEVVGGGVAGYLDRGAGRTGARAGAIAGALAFLPYLVVGVYLATTPGIALPGPDLAVAREVVIVGATSVALVFVVGTGVLGGLIGGFVRDEQEGVSG